MFTWLGGVETVLLVVVVLVLALGLLAVRRHVLSRRGGTFECSIRLREGTSGRGWVLGIARYNDEMLEWFRFFSYAYRPRVSFLRADMRVVTSREPDAVEALSLYAGQRVVVVRARSNTDVDQWELAMSSDSLTGLLSWLEAAPPGAIAATF